MSILLGFQLRVIATCVLHVRMSCITSRPAMSDRRDHHQESTRYETLHGQSTSSIDLVEQEKKTSWLSAMVVRECQTLREKSRATKLRSD